MGGVYIIAKQEKILYIGESEKDIRNRIIRHMEKIKIRKDRRADFFKLEHHHGQLTIYLMALPRESIDVRFSIEDILTKLLDPEYKRWLLLKRIKDLKWN
jgi:hypothetical protein